MEKDKILRISALLCFAALFALVIFRQTGAGDYDGLGTEYETAFVVDVLADKTAGRQSRKKQCHHPGCGISAARVFCCADK